MVGTIISRITGVARDIALIASIGTGVFSDTYSVANSIPNIIYILVAGGAINAVFVPALVRHMRDDKDNGRLFIDRLLTLVLTVLLVIVALALVAAPALMHLYATSQWSHADMRVAIVFALWCIPQVLFYGLYTLYSQILNARDVFIVPMFAPITNNLVVIATAAWFYSLTHGAVATDAITNGQLALLGAGTTLGVIVQAVVLIPALARHGYRFRPRFDWRGSGLSKVGDLASWTIGFVLVNQLTFLVISKLTTYANVVAVGQNLTPVGFTAYQKAQLMMMLPHSVVTVSIITALLPRLSRLSHQGDQARFGADLNDAMRTVLSLITPCALALVVAGPNLGRLMYGYGASTSGQGQAVGQIAALFALGLPGFAAFYVLLRAYYAREDTRTPFFVNAMFNGFHLAIGVTAFALVPEKWKVAALAAGYSVAYLAAASLAWRRVREWVPELSIRGFASRLLWASAVSGVAGLVANALALRTIGDGSAMATAACVFISVIAVGGVYTYLGSALSVLDMTQISQFRRRQMGG